MPTKPEGPAQEQRKWVGEDGRPHTYTTYCKANRCQPVPATPAPSQPAGAREFIQHFYGWDDSDMTRADIPRFSLNQAVELCHVYARQQTAAKDTEMVWLPQGTAASSCRTGRRRARTGQLARGSA